MPNAMPDVNKESLYTQNWSDAINPSYGSSQASIPPSQPREFSQLGAVPAASGSFGAVQPGALEAPTVVEESPEKFAEKLFAEKFAEKSGKTLGDRLGIPASWASPDELASMASNIEDPEALAVCVDKLLGPPTTGAPPVNAKVSVDADMTLQEKRLRTAIDSGIFDMTGVLGKAWNIAKKQNIGLAADYLAVGKSYNAQREFRLKWCKMELAKIDTTQTEIEENGQSEYSQGDYLPFDVIVDREGGPQRAASVKAALHYVMACQRFFKQNHMAGSKHFCEYNVMTHRWEFLFLRKGYRENFTKLWKIETRSFSSTEVVSEASGSGALDEGAAKANGKAPAAPAPPVATPPAKQLATPKAKGKGQKRKHGEEDPTESPEQFAKKAQKKEMDIGFRKFALLRTRMTSSSSTASDICGYISRDRKWSWAKGDANEDLNKARS
jgi:hypothetical protein